jgi:hypothetical protein
MDFLFPVCIRTHFVRKFVNELIDVEPGESHPWPWHLPICQKPKLYNDKYITRALLDATMQLYTSDTSLKPFLLDLAQVTNFAEIGQRILRATERVGFHVFNIIQLP